MFLGKAEMWPAPVMGLEDVGQPEMPDTFRSMASYRPEQLYGKRMTFEEWAEILDLRAKLVPDNTEVDRLPWRCTGCQQLMYGQEWINDKLYPSPENTPAGLFISKEYPHVCHVCWEMYHALELAPSSYWHAPATKKKNIDRLRPGGDYLAT